MTKKTIKVTAESCQYRPWINETPTDETDPNQCDTRQWRCMTKEERDEYLKKKAEEVVEVFT